MSFDTYLGLLLSDQSVDGLADGYGWRDYGGASDRIVAPFKGGMGEIPNRLYKEVMGSGLAECLYDTVVKEIQYDVKIGGKDNGK